MIFVPVASPSTSVSTTFGGVFDVAASEQRLAAIETELSRPNAWDNPEALTPLLREKRQLEDEVSRLNALKTCHDDMHEWLELAVESGEDEALESLAKQQDSLDALLDETELVMLLSGEEDNQDAILEIHPGAGGTESQDWAEMLLRMYTRWAARRHFTVEELDYLPGDEAGIKSVTLRISGPHAFGFLKSERGIHRLIRISPFDASGRRHTSFASVDVMPDVGGFALRHLPLQRPRRPEREHHQLGRARDPHPHGHLGPVPEREVPAPQQGSGPVHPQGPSVQP